MKNTTGLFGIIALIAIFTLLIISCGGDDDPIHTHSYSTAWSTDGTQHWRECSCGDKINMANHVWDWIETSNNTETKTCVTCEEIDGTRPIWLTVTNISQLAGTWKGITEIETITMREFLMDLYSEDKINLYSNVDTTTVEFKYETRWTLTIAEGASSGNIDYEYYTIITLLGGSANEIWTDLKNDYFNFFEITFIYDDTNYIATAQTGIDNSSGFNSDSLSSYEINQSGTRCREPDYLDHNGNPMVYSKQ